VRDITAFMRSALLGAIRPTDPHAFDVLRIGLSLVLIARTITELPSLFLLYGRYGAVQWPLSEAMLSPWQPWLRLSWVAGQTARLGISADTVLLLVMTAYLASLLLSTVGLGTRYFTVLAWFCHALATGSTFITEYGVDFFATSGLFYCALAPVGRLSLDHLLWKTKVRETYWATALLRILQLQLACVYFDSGVIKIFGAQWWSGEAIWQSLMHPRFHPESVTYAYDWSVLARHAWIAQATSWAVVLLELTYPFAMPFTIRRFWVNPIIFLHICIALFLGLWFFSGAMIVFNMAGFLASKPYSPQFRRS
jgi:hypothetical protein